MIVFRDAVRPPKALRRNLLLAALAVAGLVFGLIAMHAPQMSYDAGADAVAAGSLTVHHDTATTGRLQGASVVSECGGRCIPVHSMAAMVCILAMLVSALLVASTRAIGTQRRFQAWATSFSARLASVAVPAPPSLFALSISRT